MSENSKKKFRKLIYQSQTKWFGMYQEHISNGKILVVGHGLGYTTEIISKTNPNVVALDVALEPEAQLKEKVIVYDGSQFPFGDAEFDTVIVSYVLHHAKDPKKLFEEVARVSKSKIIIVEETYSNIFQKLDLARYCRYFNRKAGQKVKIYWNSYLTSKKIIEFANKSNFALKSHKAEPMRSYKAELFVFQR